MTPVQLVFCPLSGFANCNMTTERQSLFATTLPLTMAWDVPEAIKTSRIMNCINFNVKSDNVHPPYSYICSMGVEINFPVLQHPLSVQHRQLCDHQGGELNLQEF